MSFFGSKENQDCKKILKKAGGDDKSRYLPVSQVGEGGIAVVSSSFDHRLSRFVAVKKLRPENAKDPQVLAAFFNEAKLIAYLDHPGIVSIYDTFLDGEDLCYTMQLLSGETLSTVMYRCLSQGMRTMPMVLAIKTFVSICETMAYAHDKGVIHLDLKPSNVMIGQYGEVYVMDWGNARLADPSIYLRHLQAISAEVSPELPLEDARHGEQNLGTPAHMAPEQVYQKREKLSGSADIFTAGIILYQLLAGRLPFYGSTAIEVMQQILEFEPLPAHEANPDVPRKISRICERMLQKNPGDRYASFHEILHDISDFMESGLAFSTRTYNTGEIIFREGEDGGYAFLILSGKVEISKGSDGNQKVIAELGVDEIVGELSVFIGGRRTAQARALEATVIRIMNRQEVDDELEKLSPWVGKMITGLSKRFVGLSEKVVGLMEAPPDLEKEQRLRS